MGHTSFVIILSICSVLFLCTDVKGCNTKLPQHSGSGCVTLYEHCNYGGWGRSYDPGRHDLDHLLRTGTCNDRVSAVRVKPGCKLVIYEHHHFGGASLELTHDVPCLVNHKLGRGNWNDKLSSIIIHSTQPVVHAAPANHIPPCNKNLPAHSGSGCITIFEHCNYGGWGRTYGAGDFNLKQLHETGTCNDHASAVKVKPGCKVTIYQHDNFGGHSLEITNDIPCLVNHKMGNTNTNWNDHLSSIRVHSLPALPAPPSNHIPPCNKNLPQHSGSGCITIYEHCNYGGWGRSYGAGDFNLKQLHETGTCNDHASSVKIKPGCKVTIYQHDNFGGHSLEITNDIPCLVNHKMGNTNNNWNDHLSSIRVHSMPALPAPPSNHIPPCNKNLPQHSGSGCITIYEHCNYGGWGRSYSAGDFNLKQLHETGTCNDHASSVKVTQGCKVTIYQHDNFGGHSLEITNDIPCLVNHKMGNTNTNWNDHLSSIKVHSLPALPAPPSNHIPPCNKNLPAKSGSGCVRFFEHCDYKGWSRAYGQGDYTLKQFHETGTCNDQISAVKVKPGCKVTIYQHDHFGGHSLEITQDIPCLVHHKMGNSNTNWNDHMSSAKIHSTVSDVDDVISDHELKKLLHGV